MSDILRKELKTAINRWRAVPAYYSFHPEKFAGEIDAILAAHPDNRVTEWGIVSFGFPRPIGTEEEARAVGSLAGNAVITRQVTPWERAK